MPTYITLINFTQKGIESVKESTARLDAAKDLFKSMGAELKSFYLTMGRYPVRKKTGRFKNMAIHLFQWAPQPGCPTRSRNHRNF